MANNNTLPKILIKHSRIEINNYNPGDSANLEYLFSKLDNISRTRVIYGLEYDNHIKKLVCPRGMNINMLKSIFMTEPVVDTQCDPFINTPPLPIKYLARDNRQSKIIKFIIGMDEYSYTASKSQLAINSTTGSGKTFVTVASMCITGARMILITSSINWLNQWKEKILEYTNLKPEQIYTIVRRNNVDKLLNDDPTKYQVFMASHSTLHSYADNNPNGWYAIDALFKHLKCSLKVYDECHLYFNNMTKIDYHSNTYKTLYLTATPNRSAREEDIIFQEYFRTIPCIELFDPESDPHVHYQAILFDSEPQPEDIREFSIGQFQFDRNIYMRYLNDLPIFRNIFTIIIDYCLRYISGKVLIYIGINECIEDMYKYMVSNFPFLRDHIGVYNSLITDPELRHHMLCKKFILSTTKSCGAASDIADLKACVVLNEPFRSKVTARQTLGRCRDDNTLYIDCVDIGCYRTKSYYQSKLPIFKQYAKSCKESVLSKDSIFNTARKIKEFWHSHEPLVMNYFSN